MRFLHILLLAFAFLTVQGVSGTSLASVLFHDHPESHDSVTTQLPSRHDDAGARNSDHHFPHHCAAPCQVYSVAPRAASANRDVVKSLHVTPVFYIPSRLPAFVLSHEVVLKLRPELEPYALRKGAPFKGMYARTARQRL